MTTRVAVLGVLVASLLAPLATGCGGVGSAKYDGCGFPHWSARSGHQRVQLATDCGGAFSSRPLAEMVVRPGATVTVSEQDGRPQPGLAVGPTAVATARSTRSRLVVRAVRDGVATVTAPAAACIYRPHSRCAVLQVVVRG